MSQREKSFGQLRELILDQLDKNEKPARARKLQPLKRRGNCWVCDGTGRVMRSGVTKLIACGECKGSGWMSLHA